MKPLKDRLAERAARKADEAKASGEKFDKKAFVAASDASAPGWGANPAAAGDPAAGNGSGTDKPKTK